MKIAAALISFALAGCVAGDDTDADVDLATEASELATGPWQMTATVTPGYDRHFSWDMRVTPPADVELAADESRVETVGIEVWTTGVARSRLAVDGTVQVTNTGARPETLGFVDVFAGDGAATVECPVALPATVAAGETVLCRYGRVVATERPGTVWFLAAGSGGIASSSLPYRFDGPSVRITDWDRFVEILADEHIHGIHVDYVYADSAQRWTTSYRRELGPYEACAPYTAPDTVILNARDGLGSPPSGRVWFSRDATVHGQVACPEPTPEP